MKTKLLILALTAYANAFLVKALPDVLNYSDIYIYGTVTTIDDEKFTGQIRWGKEEAFWFDHFNSEKPKNENLKLLTDRDMDKLKDNDRNENWWGNWNNNYSCRSNTHSFACHFGDIKSIQPRRGERVEITLRNGDLMYLDGGSNDIGADIKIHDLEMGTIKIDWDRVSLVEFSNAPANLETAFGVPLYGTVKTYKNEFSGFLQWDHDERLSLDELNGDTNNGELDIPFGNIKSIAKTRRGSLVTLNSGRELMLTGSNDVNDENRGIIINIPSVGRVDVNWDEFESIHFETAPSSGFATYDSYKDTKQIYGTVTNIRGEAFKGRLVYDLDEAYQLEILDGIDDDLEYLIPFRYIKTIKPKNRGVSMVELKNGDSYLLGEKVDVTENNDGVLIFKSDDDYTYLPWEEIEEININ